MFEYKELAKYYDLLYSGIDYKKQSETIKDIIQKYKKSDGNELLDVACGTGRHINLLKDNFQCTGIDISRAMIKEAENKCRDCDFYASDMRSFNLNKKFDVILCLFNSINYLNNLKELEQTIINFKNHLKQGGVLILEAFPDREEFSKPFHHLRIYDGDGVKIARIIRFKPEDNHVILNINYMISEIGKEIKKVSDVDKIKIFPKESLIKSMEKVGLKVEFINKGLYWKGLFVSVNK